MNNWIKIPAIAFAGLVVAKLVVPHAAHNAPVNPSTYILNVAIDGASDYSVNMWVPFGSTSDSVPGIAHVLEHLKFKGHKGADIRDFNAVAGSASNAATSFRTTRYDMSVPVIGLAPTFQVLADMTNALDVTEADVALEKTVVTQELLQRSQSDPDAPFYQEFNSELYKGFPYEKSPGGTVESVGSVTLKDVLDFDKAHYIGSKRFILVAGPPLSGADHDALERYFPNAALGTIVVGAKFKITHEDEELKNFISPLPDVTSPEIVVSEFTKEKTSPRTRSIRFSVSKILNAPTSWRSVAAAAILQDAIRSRLTEGLQDRIAEEIRIVQDFSVSISRLLDGVWQVDFSANLVDGAAPETVRKAFETYMEEFTKTGLSQKSFDRLKARYSLYNDWENPTSRAGGIANDTMSFSYEKAKGYPAEVQAVNLQDVNDLLKAINKPGRVGIMLLKPEGVAQ
jgi:predicted Zn-dependent peptidase